MQTVIDVPEHVIGECVSRVLGGVRTATKYLGRTLTVKATMRKSTKGSPRQEVLVTIGEPNYAEREFIATQRVADLLLLPVQVRSWPKPKKS